MRVKFTHTCVHAKQNGVFKLYNTHTHSNNQTKWRRRKCGLAIQCETQQTHTNNRRTLTNSRIIQNFGIKTAAATTTTV